MITPYSALSSEPSLLTLLKKILFSPQSVKLTDAAQAELAQDQRGLLHATAPSHQAVIDANLAWLCAAQDHSVTQDGGVSRDYSLQNGWATSYPETTGYIIPTFIDQANRKQRDDLYQRARRMLDWCLAIQFSEGGFQGGKIDSTPRVPVTFNTGQILLGLAAGTLAYNDERYRKAMIAAASWLRDSLDPDGCWRKHPTPFAAPGEKAYETHVSWGLFEAERVAPGNGFGEAGLKQVDWSLTKQSPNGWFASNCLNRPDAPLTHTIGYVLRGLIEAWRWSDRTDLLNAAKLTADGILLAIESNGRLAGRLDKKFRPAADYACLTGMVQIASCYLLLYSNQADERYLNAARALNAYVRRTVRLDGPPEQRGGVKGSFPIDGDYGKWEYLNWATKFCIDAQQLELNIIESLPCPIPSRQY